jgi:hypothetical protein
VNACPHCGASVECQIVPVPHEDYEDERWSCVQCEWWSEAMPVTPTASVGEDPRLEQRPVRRARRHSDEFCCDACDTWTLADDCDYCACGCNSVLHRSCGDCSGCRGALMPDCAIKFEGELLCPECAKAALRIAAEDAAAERAEREAA